MGQKPLLIKQKISIKLNKNYRKRKSERSITRERWKEKERKKLRIFFVCGKFDDNSKWYLFFYWPAFQLSGY